MENCEENFKKRFSETDGYLKILLKMILALKSEISKSFLSYEFCNRSIDFLHIGRFGRRFYSLSGIFFEIKILRFSRP